MRKMFARNFLAFLIAAALLVSACCAAAETAYVRYDSQEYGFSFEVNAGYAVYEQDGFVWVYPGQNNSNFRLNWIADGEVDEAAFFAQTGAALREAMGDSMVSDPGEAARSLDMRGVAMDAMIYAYTDAESGAIVEGAYLWEQREGYALLYGAAYLQEDADAVLSALVHASETFAFPESAQTAEPDADFAAVYTRMNALSTDMSAATQTFTEVYSRSMDNGDSEYASAMLEYVEHCQSVQEECTLLAATLEANPGWAQQYGSQYTNAVTACGILQKYLAFYADYYHSSDPLMEVQTRAAQGTYASETELLDGMYTAMGDVRTNYLSMNCPAAMTDVWAGYVRQIDAFQDKLYADYTAIVNQDPLMQFSSAQLVARQPVILWHYESMMYTLLITQYDVCAALCSDQAPSDEANLYYSFIDEIYPNLYPSMNSAINLLLYTGSGSREVLIEAEITGFSQQYYQMVTVTPEIRFFQIKPPVLPEVPSLSGEKTTQIVLKVTDKETGAILAAESRNVTLRSLYDFSMYNNEFGMIEPYTLLAWLDPESQAILDLRRDAIDWIHTTFGEGYESLPGYQLAYPAEVSQAETTLIQALGIQEAISQRGVRYNMGPYSFGANQRVLPPAEVLSSRSGICIETALLVASALQSANMNAMIIITPGHAQVALETWEGSGEYYLLETTKLPFTAEEADINVFCSLPTADEWKEYLDRDGVYVIDCALASSLNIRGLVGQ